MRLVTLAIAATLCMSAGQPTTGGLQKPDARVCSLAEGVMGWEWQPIPGFWGDANDRYVAWPAWNPWRNWPDARQVLHKIQQVDGAQWLLHVEGTMSRSLVIDEGLAPYHAQCICRVVIWEYDQDCIELAYDDEGTPSRADAWAWTAHEAAADACEMWLQIRVGTEVVR